MIDEPGVENCAPPAAATSQEAHPSFGAGDLVRARGEAWRVVEIRAFTDCHAVHLTGTGPENAGARSTLLYPFDRPETASRPSRLRAVSRRRWGAAFRREVVEATPFGALRAAATARMDLFAYQLEPALASVRSLAPRMLLADEVGLGKTVQAGLVLAELLTRHLVAHALVLTPAGLRDQWVRELETRFRVDATVMDALELARLVSAYPAGLNPWSVPPVVVSSIDFAKRPEVVRGATAVIWDLVIVDEAHLAATAAERRAAVSALGALARRLILVTATPHAGDEEGFAALCDAGRLAGEGPILLFRRSRREVGLAAPRRVRLVHVALSPAERRTHLLLDRYTQLVWREASARGDHDARLAMIVLRKRALSHMSSLASSVERRLMWLAGGQNADEAHQLGLPLSLGAETGESDDEDEEPSAALAARGLADAETERSLLLAVRDTAREAAARDSKEAALLRLLRRVREPAIVFTEYRDTLLRLAVTIGDADRVALLHGGLTRAGRGDAERRFTCGDASLLLATDAAGQGLNLHSRCRLVINVELPWNPVRLEQRIGRVDRLGQTRVVHAIHLLAAGTAETGILGRLVARMDRVRRALGFAPDPIGAGLDDAVVAEAVGDVAKAREGAHQSTPGVVEAADLAREADAEAARLREVRRLLPSRDPPPGRTGGDAPPGALIAIRRERLAARDPDGATWAPPPGVVAVFIVRVVDGRGALIEQRVVPVLAAFPVPPLATRRDLAAAAEAWVAPILDALRRRALDEATARLAAIGPALETCAGRLRRRELALSSTVDRFAAAAGRPVQAGLFDRRALSGAEALRLACEHLRLQIGAQSENGDARGCPSLAGDPELALVLLVTA